MVIWIVDSSVLASGDRSAIGRYEECLFGSLLDLKIGMILEVFQFINIVLELTILLKRFVKIYIEWYERCFRWIGARISGRSAFEGLEFLMALRTWLVVKVMGVV